MRAHAPRRPRGATLAGSAAGPTSGAACATACAPPRRRSRSASRSATSVVHRGRRGRHRRRRCGRRRDRRRRRGLRRRRGRLLVSAPDAARTSLAGLDVRLVQRRRGRRAAPACRSRAMPAPSRRRHRPRGRRARARRSRSCVGGAVVAQQLDVELAGQQGVAHFDRLQQHGRSPGRSACSPAGWANSRSRVGLQALVQATYGLRIQSCNGGAPPPAARCRVSSSRARERSRRRQRPASAAASASVR